MKNKILQYHEHIDYISVYIFMYCLLGFILLEITNSIVNEVLRSILILGIPLLLLNNTLIAKINKNFHKVLRLKK